MYCKGYNRKAARLITAAADFIILPSLFEPCGLEDLIAQVYGTIPIANSQGGLQKIADGKTGFLYQVPGGQDQDVDKHAQALMEKVSEKADIFFQSGCTRLIDVPFFKKIIMQAYSVLQTDFSWKHIFKEQYVPLFYSPCRRV